MSATRSHRNKPSQSPTWEEIESLLVRELKNRYRTNRHRNTSIARILRQLKGDGRRCAAREGRA